ncbi:hypothetical protein M885DRAFT_561819 [Pelagophyceae sp. CCMP2097]|nr:hypothetical protein M885DRAFT_561819 [Pelagophyceae sp. CCMP2097]
MVLGGTTVVAGTAVWWAHYSQVRDYQLMHEAVIKDKERLRMLGNQRARETPKAPPEAPREAPR